MFVLLTQGGACRGVFECKETLARGVNHWIKKFPHDTLAYELWNVNNYAEPSEWDWVYIAPNSKIDDLMAGGGEVPPKELWGKNLLNEKV